MEFNDEYFMSLALKEAREAFLENEVPVGAVIVKDNEVIAKGRNSCEMDFNPTAHAEINAIKEACKKLKLTRLKNCTIYVTLEPCPMCAGAILNAGIERAVFGAEDENFGAMGGIIDLSKVQPLKGIRVKKGILREECAYLLRKFFTKLR